MGHGFVRSFVEFDLDGIKVLHGTDIGIGIDVGVGISISISNSIVFHNDDRLLQLGGELDTRPRDAFTKFLDSLVRQTCQCR